MKRREHISATAALVNAQTKQKLVLPSDLPLVVRSLCGIPAQQPQQQLLPHGIC